MANSVKGVIQSSKYMGNIQVTWFTEYNNTVVTSDHWMTYLRTKMVIDSLCIILQIWILAWPLLRILTRRWNVVTIEYPDRVFCSADGIWPTMDEDPPSYVQDGVPYQGARVEMTPQAWVDRWKVAIVRSAWAKRQYKLRICDPAKDERMVPWQPLGSFDTIAGWGRDEGGA